MAASIFETAHQNPQALVTSLVSSLQTSYGRPYPWAIGKGRQLPSGYILAKKKKAYQSGRPIMSFSPFRPMPNILAWMIFQLIPVACPSHFASGDVYTLLRFFKKLQSIAISPCSARIWPFFHYSIDQARFLGAWYMLLDFLRPHMDVGDNEVLSRQIQQSWWPHQRSHVPTPQRHPQDRD